MSQPITLDDLADRLTTILSDPALTSVFKAKCPALAALLDAVPAAPVRKVEPLPVIPAITAVQAAVFDNWPRGHPEKSYPNRYALAVEIWTSPADEIEVARLKDYQHKCSFSLMDGKTLKDWATRTTRQNPTRKHPLSADYLADLVAAADALTSGQYIGVCCAKVHGEGTVYFDDQWILVEVSGTESVATLSVHGERSNWHRSRTCKPTASRTAATSFCSPARIGSASRQIGPRPNVRTSCSSGLLSVEP